jgi:hypothetical protein
MEAGPDDFLKVLQKRQRNLAKKLDRIRKKQADLKSTGKEIKEEEKKMIESAPQVEELLAETEKLISQYQSHLETSQKDQKKPQPKPEVDRTAEIVHLWVLGEFLSNPLIKEKFTRENSTEQDLEAFLLLHNQAKGQVGEKFSDIVSGLEKSVELYLSKSDKVAPGTLRTYRKISEFTTRGLTWCLNQHLPQVPIKSELTVQTVPVYSTQIVLEKKPEIEEVKVEVKVEPKPEVKTDVYPVSTWAQDEEEDESEEKKEEIEQKPNVVEKEDDGFIEVTSKRPRTSAPKENRNEDKGRPRGTGRGRGRRGGYRNGPRNN